MVDRGYLATKCVEQLARFLILTDIGLTFAYLFPEPGLATGLDLVSTALDDCGDFLLNDLLLNTLERKDPRESSDIPSQIENRHEPVGGF